MLSKKFKAQIRKIAISITLAVTSVLVLFALGTNLDSIVNSNKKAIVEAKNPELKRNSNTNITVEEDGAILGDSIVQIVRDSDLVDGTYTFRVNGVTSDGTAETKEYLVELINYYDDVTYTENTALGDTSTEYKMLVVKYHKNLTINTGVTLTATRSGNYTYKKGMFICVMGTLINKGTLTMTARGTYNQVGEDVYLWKNTDDTFEYVPAVGGAGAAKRNYVNRSTNSNDYYLAGIAGGNGGYRATGGGGSGGLYTRRNDYSSYNASSGAGAAGTSYSGGSGGGGLDMNYNGTRAAGAGAANGGKGGDAYSARGSTGWAARYAGGGAGNIGGYGKYTNSGASGGSNNASYNGQNGTGGLLVVFTPELYNLGTISSNGSNGGSGRGGGGSSGGGSINIFTYSTIKRGTITANGGAAVGSTKGGAGGTGATVLTTINPEVTYADKKVTLSEGQNYSFDISKLTYGNVSNNDTYYMNPANYRFDVNNNEVATVNASGVVTAVGKGSTLLKITDVNNEIVINVFIEVLTNSKVQLQEGKNFTVALKENGTVWTYGLNNKGQLGIGNNEDKTIPNKIEGLSGVKQIAAGYAHALALLDNGEIYSFGQGTNGELGNGDIVDSNVPVQVEGLSNIVQIDAYKNISIALDEDGKVYVWGEGYSSLPIRVIFSERVVAISGKLMLTDKMEVYSITDTSAPISGLSNIVKVSCGEAHNLALDYNGIVYAWGTNTYGECGSATTGAITNYAFDADVTEISAGNGVSIVKHENGDVYVLGNNANGQIGLGSTAKATVPTKVVLSEDVPIETISAGEGTHTGLMAEDGYVWHAGTNTKGEIGIGNNTNQTAFVKTGDAIVTTNQEDLVYLDIGESITLFDILENTYNLKIDLIDDNQSNFTIALSNENSISLQDRTITANNYGKTIVTITHTPTERTKEITISVVLKLESIVQGFKDSDLPDGDYEILVNGKTYSVELVNYYDDMQYSLENGQTSRTVSLGDDTTDYKLLVVKYHKDLIIDKGVTLTAERVNNLTYKKGMYICVLGDIYNNGAISMTARGTYNQEGEDVFLWHNIDDSYEYVPAEGGAGGKGVGGKTSKGNPGVAGTNRATGGGGAGGSAGTKPKQGGNGSAGTSYSGGSGGGGSYHCAGAGTYAGGNAKPNGGAGGTGAVRTDYGSNSVYASGGAGNTAGAGAFRNASGSSFGGATTLAENGTGGLLILYTNTIYNEGTISSNGSNVNGKRINSTTRYAGGGASGAGSVNIFANIVREKGTMTTNGGKSNLNAKGITYYTTGAAGGNGSVTINELGSILNYGNKSIKLDVSDVYSIDRNKLSYTKLNTIQTRDLVLGRIVYESLDSSIASVDSNGKITGVAIGTTKIKITDIDNGYSTYIIVNVTRKGVVIPEIKEGANHTVTLKANGTVWAYGLNNKGQVGNGTLVNTNEPVAVLDENEKELSNIVEIEANENSSIAVDKNGKVYIWGEYTYLDETTNSDVTESINFARKVEGLNNITKVGIYNGNFYAINTNGVLYIFGKGYSEITRIETKAPIADISGNILLGEDGLVYKLTDVNTPLNYLSCIVEIAGGDDHYLFVNLDGEAYSLGKNDKGQLGDSSTTERTVPVKVKTINGYLENVASISAGSKTSMAVDYDGNAYVWGDNTNTKLGITAAQMTVATKVASVQNKVGTAIELPKFEVVETGKTYSSLMDDKGFVYSVGVNTNGNLGTEDNTNRKIFTKIGRIEIITRPEEIKVTVGTTKDIAIIPSNSFNLKTDVAYNSELEVYETNTREVQLQEISGVDNSDVINKDNYIENYKFDGQKIGRNVVVAKTEDGEFNFWVNVVDKEEAKASAKVENGNGFTVALKSDGTVWTWGKNTSGELGIGTTINYNEPKKVDTTEDIIDISVGERHTLLLGKSGKVYSFGYNANGQLGTGNSTTYKAPVDINLSNISKVIAIRNTSFAITDKGEVYAWGEGYKKTITKQSIEGNIIDIGKTYYLADDGVVRILSNKQEILLSFNEYDPSESPVIEDEKIVQISEGNDFVLMVSKTGKVYSYGTNTYGQLGDGTLNPRQGDISTAVKIEAGNILTNVSEVSAGNNYAIAVTKDGKVYTWGINGNNQLGFDNVIEEGGIQESSYALLKEDVSNIERVSAGYVHTAIYKRDGNVYTFGDGTDGSLGNGANSNYAEAQIVGKTLIKTNTNEIILEENDTFDIDAWVNYFNLFGDKETEFSYEILDNSIGLLDPINGGLYAIEEGRTSIIVNEVGTNKIAVISLRVLAEGTKPTSVNVQIEPQVETAGNHVTMLKVDGTVWCYGLNAYGELGNNTQINSDEPVQALFAEGTVITKIAVGENHNLALDSNGYVWTWGRNNYYQLGNTDGRNILQPTKITSINNIKDIACGNNTSYVLTEEGEIYAWGLNANGECGIGSYTNRVTINKALYMTDIIDIKAGKNHAVALRSDGEVYVTGSNIYGELAKDMNTRKINVFTKVDGLKDITSIAVGDSNTTVLRKDSKVFSWGENIYKELGNGASGSYSNAQGQVTGLSDIRYIDGGKGYNVAINGRGEVYTIGLNSSGELGDNTTTNQVSYTKSKEINDVIYVSAGTGNTVYLKKDGTVWANGDYTHGDTEIKAKTRSAIPVQVGNDETGLNITELVIAKDGTKRISDKCAFELNLIKLDKNFVETLQYISLNEEIATVDENGIVTGVRVGTTRINAIANSTGRIYSVLVKVVENSNQTAPKIVGGEDFVATLKADGSAWTWGYNSDGRLALGNNITRDVPTKTNILATYVDIKIGKDFIIALRDEGKVWSSGNNNVGQLGINNTDDKSKLVEIQGLSDIVRIAAGENFGIAIDKLGIIYKWGDGVLAPEVHQITSQRVIDISAGGDQSVYVTAKGTVLGEGSILDGEISGINNAIKTVVTDDSIIILTSNNLVYEYKSGTITQININGVIDIAANAGSVMYQTVDEKVYVSGTNTNGELGIGTSTSIDTPTMVTSYGTDIFAVGAGEKNTYVIKTNGNVYSAGNNTYGTIGNGTRSPYNVYTLVGKRNFKADPKSSTMKVGDVEDVVIKGEPFNVFGKDEISSDEYNWSVDDSSILDVNEGVLTAVAQGTAHVTIEDKLTLERFEITRIIIEPDKDRIKQISVNNSEAGLKPESTENDMKYEVKVVTNGDKGQLKITTNDNTDRISIDNGTTWSYNGSLNQEIDLVNKFTTLTITVGIQNNAGDYPLEETYELTIEKITDDIELKKITVTSNGTGGSSTEVVATPVSLTRYEAVVDEETEISLVNVLASSQYTEVSIDGDPYNLETASKYITIGNNLSKQVSITVRSEAGTESEYTLTLYKKNNVFDLNSLKVNNKEATKVNEGEYAINVGTDCDIANIVATVTNNLAQISIENDAYKSQVSTKSITLFDLITEVPIKVKLGDDVKEYKLTIIRELEDEHELTTIKLDMLMVNGNIIEPENDGLTYIAYLPSSETEARIRAIAKTNNTSVKIDNNMEEIQDSERTVLIPNVENTFTVLLEDNENNTRNYTVIIRKAEADVSLKEIHVVKDNKDLIAKLQEDGTYLVKVPNTYDNVDVTAITGYTLSKVDVGVKGEYKVHEDTQNIALTNETTEVSIKVQSKDGSIEKEYTLKIQKQSTDASLMKVEVNDTEVTLGTDNKYHYYLSDALLNVEVKAITTDDSASVRISNSGYKMKEQSRLIDITSKQTEVPIKVKAEDGTVREYILVIEGLPDDATIAKVEVNGQEARYVEGKNRFEIRLEGTSFNVEVTLSDILASMILGNNAQTVGTDSITITKTGSETTVKVKVTSQNGLETEEYTIAILEKSNNTNMDTIVVNGKIITPRADGTYYTGIKHSDTQINVKATAEDAYAITKIDNINNSSYIAEKQTQVVDGTDLYTYIIEVTAEDGTTQTYNLTVERLEENTNVLSLKVGETEKDLYDAIFKEDGTYYYKIGRVNDGFVSIELESNKSSVTINGVSSTLEEVRLQDEINTIPITVKAEDGTIRDIILIIEKLSNDTSVKSITGEGILDLTYETDSADIFVDEDMNQAELTVTLNALLARIKEENDTDFVVNSITKTIDLSSYIDDGVVTTKFNIIAEDGTELEYAINIYKKSNVDISSVVVNSEEVTYNQTNSRYEKVVLNGNKPVIVITADNPLQTVQLLKLDETVLATGTGTLTTTQTLNAGSLETEYIIRITSHNGDSFGTEDYKLWIRQKSTETGITYIKVDGLGTTVSGTTYSATVSGKNTYPVDIKLRDDREKVRVEDLNGNILIPEQIKNLTGNISVPDGEIRTFKVVVISENGDIKNYTLSVERISSNYEVSGITVTDYDVDGETIITKNVTIYDSATKTYKIVINKELTTSDIEVTAQSSFTNVLLDNIYSANGVSTMTKTLNGLGITEVTIKLTAADGTIDTRTLQLIQLSDDIGIEEVKVDGNVVTPDESGNYELTVSDEIDLTNIKVTLVSESSKVKINGINENYGMTEVNISKGTSRTISVPIKVTAEDGTEFTYTLTLHIISHNTNIEYIKVDDETAVYSNNKYRVYFDTYATEATVDIKTEVEYATITHTMVDESTIQGVQYLTYNVDTSDLAVQTFTTIFKVIAENGTEQLYEVELTRKNDDNSISNVYVNNHEIEENIGHIEYLNGTYGNVQIVGNTAKIKVVATNELSTVTFNGISSLKELEQVVQLSTVDKITEVPVKITSQQGTELDTIIYIEKVSDNYNLEYVKVNNETADQLDEITFRQYIYDTMISTGVEIKTESDEATIVRVTEDGITYLDENAASYQGKGTLSMTVSTPDKEQSIYFKVIAENGDESEVYEIVIEKMSTDTSLLEIYVDGEKIELNADGKYVTTIYDINTSPLIKAVTTHEKANVRIGLGDERLHISEQNVNVGNSRQVTIPITVRSQAGTSKVTYLYLNKISTSLSLNLVTLDSKEANVYDDQRHTYRFLVESDAEEFELFALADSDYTIIEYNGEDFEASLRTTVNVPNDVEGKVIKLKTKSESGNEQEYAIEIARRSDNTNLAYLKVDDRIRQPNIENGDTYTVRISRIATTALIEVQTEYSYANLRLGDNQVVRAYDKGIIDISDLTEDRIVVPIVVMAADGTTIRTYNVVLLRCDTQVVGSLETDNAEGKHIANIYVYESRDTTRENLLSTAVSNEDGTFAVDVPAGGTFDIVVEKLGYLEHTVRQVEVDDYNYEVLEKIRIYAGDIDESDEIELDDLVELNDHIGEEVTNSNKVYDLNEDGVIDVDDRSLIKSNYHKKSTSTLWIKVEHEDYILPLDEGYTISSEYGYRVDPFGDGTKFHSGVDMVGEHHGNVYSIANGKVTFAGVQSGYGNCVEIKHFVNGETIYSFYAHLSRIDVAVGENVIQGRIIGLEGGAETDPNPGQSTGHHLHFELRSESGSGHSINPHDYIDL